MLVTRFIEGKGVILGKTNEVEVSDKALRANHDIRQSILMYQPKEAT